MTIQPHQEIPISERGASVEAMQRRFESLWRDCALPDHGGHGESVWHLLNKYYSEPHRHYHTQGHIERCIEKLDLAQDEIPHPSAVEMALWFHDAIYQPGAPDNEAQSAVLFRQHAAGVMPPELVKQVENLIMVTTHRRLVEDLDQRFICDIDLIGFGSPREVFIQDTAAVRAEHPGSEQSYRDGTRGFLSYLSTRQHIFQTAFFHQNFEQTARQNIAYLLETL